MNYIYIKDGRFLTFDFELDSKYNIGTTYEDYSSGKYVKLNDDQIAFRTANPTANTYEVWNMKITVYERTLDQAKSEMINKIIQYDSSDAVNSFTYNGVSTWFAADKRKGYEQSILSCKTLGLTSIQVPIGSNIVTMAITEAEVMLAKVHLYADSCFMVTTQHEAAVQALTTVAEVDAYDYTTGYPEKLVFTT